MVILKVVVVVVVALLVVKVVMEVVEVVVIVLGVGFDHRRHHVLDAPLAVYFLPSPCLLHALTRHHLGHQQQVRVR